MKPSLHQDSASAQLDHLLHFAKELLVAVDVAFPCSTVAIKSAKGADRHAYVRIIDIAVDHVCDNVVRMKRLSQLIGELAKFPSRCGGLDNFPLFEGQPLARLDTGKQFRSFSDRDRTLHKISAGIIANEGGSQKSEVRGQKSEVRSQRLVKAELKKSEVRKRNWLLTSDL